VKPGGNVIRDEEILLEKMQEQGTDALMRRIEAWVEGKQQTMMFVTNHRKWAATTIAAIYQCNGPQKLDRSIRWEWVVRESEERGCPRHERATRRH